MAINEGQEVAKDLTMLKQGESAGEASLNELQDNLPEGGSQQPADTSFGGLPPGAVEPDDGVPSQEPVPGETELPVGPDGAIAEEGGADTGGPSFGGNPFEVNDMEAYETYKKNRIATQYSYANREGGEVDVDLDRGRGLDEERDVARARNQGTGTKLAKAVFGGAAQGVLIAAEEAGYFADVTGWADAFGELEEMSGNWWTRKMKEYQEQAMESDAFKIYDSPSDPNNVLSQIFKWTSVQSTFGSAIGFGLTGMAAGGIVKAATNAKKFGNLMKGVDTFLGAAEGTAMSYAAGRGGELAASGLSNYFMGQMMAVDTYNITLDKLKTRIGTGPDQISLKEAKAIAATEAQDAVWLNMALMATSSRTFANVFRGTKKTKALLTNPTAVNQMKEFTLKGAPTAFVENVYQEMLQMEQIYDAEIAAGVKELDYSKDFWTRAGELALSDRAVNAGAMGIGGGPIQFALIQRPFMGEQIKKQKEAYKNQQKLVDWHKKVVARDFETYREHRTNYLSAISKGDKTLATLSEDMEVHSQLIKAAEWQYIDHLKDDILKKIEKGESDLKNTEDYDENWKEKAQQFVADIDRVNNLFQVSNSLTNTGDVVYNTMVLTDVEKAKRSMDSEIKELFNTRDKEIAIRYPEEAKVLKFDDKGKIAPLDITGMSEADAIKARVAYDRATNKVNKYLDTSETQSSLIKKQGESKKLINLIEKLEARRKYLLSPEGQKAGAEQNTTNTEKINEKVAKGEADANKEATKEVTDKEIAEQEAYRDFTDVETEGIEKAKDRIAETDKQISERKATKGHLAFKDDSFSSRKGGKRQVFTPNEIRVSKDGRYFKVLRSSTEKSDPTKESMPVLMEVEKKGSNYVIKDIRTDLQKKKGVKKGGNAFKFILGDLGFLRSEALQAAYFGGSKKPTYYASYWSSYSDAYSPIKPADLDFNNRRVDYATKGEATTLNIPVALRESDKYRHFKDYDLDAFSKPFEGEYEVEIRVSENTGPGNNLLLDVIKIDQEGNEVKLPPIDPHYNMNYSAIYAAAKKGVVKAKVTEHFSKGANIGNMTDGLGNPIYNDVGVLKQLPKEFKHNGKLYLARTHRTASKDLMRVAIDEDGNTFTGSIDGLAIPTIGQGDVAALILGPGNRLVPVQLSAKNLDQVPSKDGDGTAIDDIINGTLDAIDVAFKDVIAEGVAKDKEILDKLRGTNKFVDDYNSDGTLDTESEFAGQRLSVAFKKEKAASMSAYNKEFFDLLEKGPKQLIAEVSDYQYLGKIMVAGKMQAAVDKSTLNEFFFKLSYGIANDGTITPTVQKNVNGKKAFIKLKDDPIGFKAALSQKRKRVSIEDMTSADNSVSKRVWDEGLTTDLDYNNPFQGASGTLKFDDEYIVSEGTADAKKVLTNISPKGSAETLAETRTKAESAAKLEALREYDAVYTDIVQMKDPLRNVLTINDSAYSESQAKDYFYEIVTDLGFTSNVEANRIMKEVFDTDPATLDEAEKVIIDEIAQELKDVEFNKDIMTLGLHALTKINEKVQSGDIELIKTVAYKNRTVDPKYIHPEGIDLSFPKGTTVFHRTFGEMKVTSRYKKDNRSIYTLEAKRKKKDGTPYTKTVKAFPSQVGLKNGLFRKLVGEQKRLRKKNISETEKTTVANNIFHLERRLQKSRGETVEATSDGKGDTKGFSNEELAYKESFEDVSINYSVIAEFNDAESIDVESAMKSQRAWDIARSIQHHQVLKEAFSADPGKAATKTDVDASLDAIKKMVFISPKELLSLIKKAESDNRKDDVIALKNGLNLINKLNDKTFKGNEFDYISTGLDGKENRSTYRFPATTMRVDVGVGKENIKQTESSTVGSLNGSMNLIIQDVLIPMYMSEIVLDNARYQEAFTPKTDSSSKNNETEVIKTTSTGIRFNPNITTSKPKDSGNTGGKGDIPGGKLKDSFRKTKAEEVGVSDGVFATAETFIEAMPTDVAATEVLKRIAALDKSFIHRSTFNYGLLNIDPKSPTLTSDIESVLGVLEKGTENLTGALTDTMDSEQRRTYANFVDEISNMTLDIAKVKPALKENFADHMKVLGAKLNLMINLGNAVYNNDIDSNYIQTLGKDGTVKQGPKVNKFLKMPPYLRSFELGFDDISDMQEFVAETGTVNWTDAEIAEAKRVAALPPSVRKAHYEALKKKPKPKDKPKPKEEKDTEEEIKTIGLLESIGVPVMFKNEAAEVAALKNLDPALYDVFKSEFDQTDRNLSDLTALLTDWSDNGMVEFDATIGKPKFKEVEGSVYDAMNEASDVDRTTEAFKAEVAESKRMLPQVPIHIVENVTELAKKFGNKSIGYWDNGVRYVVKNAEFGTVHHETFHAVADMYLTAKDKKRILKQLGENKWSLKIEEKLARDFETFMRDKKNRDESSKTADKKSGVVNYIKNLFKDLVAWVKNTRSKDYTQKVFENIESGKYAKTASNLSNLMTSVMLDKSTDAANFKDTLSVKNRLILQNMEKSGQIIIKC